MADLFAQVQRLQDELAGLRGELREMQGLRAKIASLEKLLTETQNYTAHHAPEHAGGRDPFQATSIPLLDHGTLVGLTDDDHTQYLKESDFDDIDFLVGTATGHTAAEIVVGTSPGGELGGTWASPTVDATHSGSAHHTRSHAVTGTSDHTASNWKVLYTNGSGQVIELSLGADGTFLQANGVAAAPSFAALVAGDIPGTTQSVVLIAAGGAPATTAGCAAVAQAETTTNDVNYFYLAFDGSSDEACFWSLVLPNWDGGTFTFQVNWTVPSGTGSVVWGLKAASRADDEAIDQAWGSEVTVTDTVLAAGDDHWSPVSSAVTAAGTPAEGESLYLNFVRRPTDASDTLTTDAWLKQIVIKYTTATYAD